MATYVDEEEVWKCPKHPSRRRRKGVCPTCLRERLVSLPPDPFAAATTSSSSSSDGDPPALRRSRSLAIPFLRSDSKTASFLSTVLMRSRTRKEEIVAVDGDSNNSKIEEFSRMVTRSRSVAAAGTRRPYKFWNFATPLKAFKTYKAKQKQRG